MGPRTLRREFVQKLERLSNACVCFLSCISLRQPSVAFTCWKEPVGTRSSSMAYRGEYDVFERDFGIVPDIVKQFVVYLYRHIRSGHTAGQLFTSSTAPWSLN